jgi:hypothetical protein
MSFTIVNDVGYYGRPFTMKADTSGCEMRLMEKTLKGMQEYNLMFSYDCSTKALSLEKKPPLCEVINSLRKPSTGSTYFDLGWNICNDPISLQGEGIDLL